MMAVLAEAARSILVAGSVLLGAAWLAASLMRRRSAASRHAVWVVADLAAAAWAVLAVMPIRIPQSGLVPDVLRVEALSGGTGASGEAAGAGALLAWLWAAVAALLVFRVMVSQWKVRRLVENAGVLAEGPALKLVDSPQGMGPMIWGLSRPVVFLPRESAGWDEGLRDAVLRHEMAHWQRGDCWWLLLSRLLAAVFWFQPLAWLAARRIQMESERAADDAVLRSGVAGQSYAEWLIGIARSVQRESEALLAMGSSLEFEGRLKAVLDRNVNRAAVSRRRTLALALSAVCLLLPLAAAQKAKPKDKVYKIGNGVSAPAPIYKVEPQYTEEARDAKLQGPLLVEIEIDKDGVPRNIKVLKPLGLGLDEKAVEAIQQWRFKPGMKDGKPVRVFANVEVNFRLN